MAWQQQVQQQVQQQQQQQQQQVQQQVQQQQIQQQQQVQQHQVQQQQHRQQHHVQVKTELPLVTGATRWVSIEFDTPPGLDSQCGVVDPSRGIVDPSRGIVAPHTPQGPPVGPPFLCCWVREDSLFPLFSIPLKGARVVNNITELG